MHEIWEADMRQRLSFVVVTDESAPTDLSVATSDLQGPASWGEAIGVTAVVITIKQQQWPVVWMPSVI